MFSTISMTGSGLLLLVLNLILQLLDRAFGIHIDVLPEQLQQFVDAVAQVLSFVLMIWGQLRRPDMIAGLVRVKSQQ